MSTETAQPLITLMVLVVSGLGTLLTIVKVITSWGESRAKIELTKVQAEKTKAEAELVKAQADAVVITAKVGVAEAETKARIDVIAAAIREQDASTAERRAILSALEAMTLQAKEHADAATEKARILQAGVDLSNQQNTDRVDKVNRLPDNPMTTQEADIELAQRRATDKAVSEGAPVPPPSDSTVTPTTDTPVVPEDTINVTAPIVINVSEKKE